MLGERPAIEIVKMVTTDDPPAWGLPTLNGPHVLILIRMHNISGWQDWTRRTAVADLDSGLRLAELGDGPGAGSMGNFSESVIAYRDGWPHEWEPRADPTQWIVSLPGSNF